MLHFLKPSHAGRPISSTLTLIYLSTSFLKFDAHGICKCDIPIEFLNLLIFKAQSFIDVALKFRIRHLSVEAQKTINVCKIMLHFFIFAQAAVSLPLLLHWSIYLQVSTSFDTLDLSNWHILVEFDGASNLCSPAWAVVLIGTF